MISKATQGGSHDIPLLRGVMNHSKVCSLENTVCSKKTESMDSTFFDGYGVWKGPIFRFVAQVPINLFSLF